MDIPKFTKREIINLLFSAHEPGNGPDVVDVSFVCILGKLQVQLRSVETKKLEQLKISFEKT